jgi:4a-hydroxytetrahydrobiopterin dehydratase
MWTESENKLIKNFQFESFEQAMEFMQLAAVPISRLNHHPEWKNVYNRIEVHLTTHDAGNTVTDLDWKLAEILDVVFNEMKSEN